jgi:hypothetical protein
MVITATSVIKIWTRKQEKCMEYDSMQESRIGHPTLSGLSMKQMLTLLVFTALLNFIFTHSQALSDIFYFARLAIIRDDVHSDN